MPLYNYYFLDCEKTYEVIVPLKEYGTKVECPKCKKDLKKHITPVHLSSKRTTAGY